MAAEETVRKVLEEGTDFAIVRVAQSQRQLPEVLTELYCAMRREPPYRELARCEKCGSTDFTSTQAQRCSKCGHEVVQIAWTHHSAEQEMLRLLHSGGTLFVAVNKDSTEVLGFALATPCAMRGINTLVEHQVMLDVVRVLGRQDRYVFIQSYLKEESRGVGLEQILLARTLTCFDQGEGVPLLARAAETSPEYGRYAGLRMQVCARFPVREGMLFGGLLKVS